MNIDFATPLVSIPAVVMMVIALMRKIFPEMSKAGTPLNRLTPLFAVMIAIGVSFVPVWGGLLESAEWSGKVLFGFLLGMGAVGGHRTLQVSGRGK